MSTGKKVAGIFMDKDLAIVVLNHDGHEVTDFAIKDKVKFEHQHGNSNENAAHNAEITNRTKFFKDVDHLITNSEEIFVTGPSTLQEQYKHHLSETPQYKNAKVVLGTSAHLSEDQTLQTVKEHYNA